MPRTALFRGHPNDDAPQILLGISGERQQTPRGGATQCTQFGGGSHFITAMTSTSGSYMFCDADLSFSMALICTGPNCNSIISQNSLTCTKTGSKSWDCTNGVKCASSTGFTSNFSVAETNMTVSQTQNVSLNSTSFVFQQDGAGNATIFNGTTTISSGGSSTAVASSTTASLRATQSTPTVSSPNGSPSGSGSSRQSYSTIVLFAMVFLGVFVTQTSAQVTAASIGNTVNAIFQGLDKVGDGKSLFDIGASAVAGEFNTIAVKMCAAFVSQGATSIAGLPLAYGQCEEALVGAEMSLIGRSLNVTLRSYAGLGGVLANALTASEEATVIAADPGAIPELFHINSALCGLLVAVIQHAVQNPSSEDLCSALESAAVSHEPTFTSSALLITATAVSKSASGTASQATPTPSGALPADFASNKCIQCFLNTYLDSLNVISAETCNNAPVVSASAYDLSGIFCDPGITAAPSSTAFCQSLCANPCASFAVATIVKEMGADYIANPAANPDQLGKLCSTCSSPNQVPANYQCKPVPTCLCGIGTHLCARGCPGVA